MGFLYDTTSLQDVILISPQVFGDERGFFMETYHKESFYAAGIQTDFVQDNHSKSKKWVLRGLHFQSQHTQAKLVRVVSGAVLDIVVDLRVGSPSFGQYIVVELSAINKQQLFVPKWCAHGFLTLEDDTEFLYKCDDLYDPEHDSGILYNDPDLRIDWESLLQHYRITELTISEKDQQQKSFAQYLEHPLFHYRTI